MAFKLRSGNKTPSFKMMGSSPMQLHDGTEHVPTEQQLREQAARDARKDTDYSQSTVTSDESAEASIVRENAKSKTPKLHGKYKEGQVKEMLAGGLENLTDAERAKLSRSGQLSNTGQSNMSRATREELNSTLEANTRETKTNKTTVPVKKTPRKKVTEYYTNAAGNTASKTGYAGEDGKLPAYEGQGNFKQE